MGRDGDGPGAGVLCNKVAFPCSAEVSPCLWEGRGGELAGRGHQQEGHDLFELLAIDLDGCSILSQYWTRPAQGTGKLRLDGIRPNSCRERRLSCDTRGTCYWYLLPLAWAQEIYVGGMENKVFFLACLWNCLEKGICKQMPY